MECSLCGKEIKAPKGIRNGELSREHSSGAHDSCRQLEVDIMNKHGINRLALLEAIIKGLVELHPEVEQTKAVFDYRNREDEMKEEMLRTFPYLRKKEEEKKNG